MRFTAAELTDNFPDLASALEAKESLTQPEADAEFARLTSQRKYDQMLASVTNFEANLASATAEVDAYASVVAALPTGPTKTLYEEKLYDATYKKTIAERKLGKVDIVSQKIQNQKTANLTAEKQLITDMIAELNAHAATL
jgi:phospholipid N-methyltransferase